MESSTKRIKVDDTHYSESNSDDSSTPGLYPHSHTTHTTTPTAPTLNASTIVLDQQSSSSSCPIGVRNRHICHLGTREIVQVLSFTARPDKVDQFEIRIQDIANRLYQLKAGVTDIRVAHPQEGSVMFIVTFLSKADKIKFNDPKGWKGDICRMLAPYVVHAQPVFDQAGTLMPAAHTLESLCDALKQIVSGDTYAEHNVSLIGKELSKWFPRPMEYDSLVKLPAPGTGYSRELICKTDYMHVLLMTWPPGGKSAIHDHDNSSCFVYMVEGSVDEVQYSMPVCDRAFLDKEMKQPSGAIGRCSPLRLIKRTTMVEGQVQYANNEIACHSIENNTPNRAITLHVYAPGLKKMRLFMKHGRVTVSIPPIEQGQVDRLGHEVHPDGILDVKAWQLEMERAEDLSKDALSEAGYQCVD